MLFGSFVNRARLLAVLLLAAISWGSTAEFTHHHGVKAKSGETFSSAAGTPAAVETTATRISSSNTNDTSSKSKTGGECLICQLHQNLSVTVISHAPGVGPTEAQGIRTPLGVLVELSEVSSTGQGRAPPSYL
jgi:hypothetical protein